MRIFLITMVAVCLITGCSRREETKQTDLNRAYRLIDSERADEAAVLLEDLLQKDPYDNQVKVALASAYAKLAGLSIYSYYDLFYDDVFSKPLTKNGDKKISKPSSDDQPGQYATDDAKKLNIAMAKLAFYFFSASDFVKAFFNIPVVTPGKEEDYLNQAIMLMESMDKKSSSEHIFTSTLYVVQFKLIFYYKFVPQMVEQRGDKCYANFTSINQNISSLNRVIDKLVFHLSVPFPSKAKELTTISDTATDTLKNIGQLAQDLGEVDTTILSLLEEDLMQKKIGAEFKCAH